MKKKYILPHAEVVNIKLSHALLIGSNLLDEETVEVWAPPADLDPVESWTDPTSHEFDLEDEEIVDY